MNDIITSVKNRKAPGYDGLHLELFHYAPHNVKLRVLDILNICWMTYTIPNDWQKAIIIPIFKKGDRNNCNNYWGISLLTATYKICAKIITRHLNGISEVVLSEEQHGFRKGCSCMDCILAIKHN
jgi:hypothetical protein